MKEGSLGDETQQTAKKLKVYPRPKKVLNQVSFWHKFFASIYDLKSEFLQKETPKNVLVFCPKQPLETFPRNHDRKNVEKDAKCARAVVFCGKTNLKFKGKSKATQTSILFGKVCGPGSLNGLKPKFCILGAFSKGN
ncbi:hypothetical protein TNIN_347901 [Trichonephila inaurata madagascariensis]|uniref:Uncharacterized protein n=1 Tax=Trichonephila inaurata madagascariensis TaxID=2747483 RepID=A0A8X6YQ82_9ARAC|nr:hypothetical protein TNIN_347901 [Trichonephila inaurata madagascariensis]